MKQKLLILFLLFLPLLTYGQRGYFSTDTATYSGIKLKDGGSISNAKYCKVDKDDKIKVYSPYEVSEYGFKNGRVYIAKEIQTSDSAQKVFLERLHKGKVTLYYYKGRGFHSYYIEKDSTLFIEVPRRNSHNEHYSQQLLKILSDCPIIEDACTHVNYSTHSMTRLLERYDNCEERYFPRFRFGLIFGYELTRLNISKGTNSSIKQFDFKYDGGYKLGAFIDYPISTSNYSLHVESAFSKHGYSYNVKNETQDLDFVANISTLNIPVLIRYTWSSTKLRPFFNAGISANYNFKNEAQLFESIINDNVINIIGADESIIIDELGLGYCIGAGVEYDVFKNNALFFEMRYGKQYPFSDKENIGTSTLAFSTGIYF